MNESRSFIRNVTKKRLIYIDLVRLLALFFVFIQHLRYNFIESKIFSVEQLWDVGPFQNEGFAYGDLGVSLFIFISGTSLAISYCQKNNNSLKKFYINRFLRIFPIFWIIYISFFLWYQYLGYLPEKIHFSNLLFTLTGIDTYFLSFFQFTSYALIGDWFIGFIILIYVIFPFMGIILKKYPIIFGILMVAITFVAGHIASIEPLIRFIPIRFMELGIGMLYGRYIHVFKTHHYIIAFIISLFYFILEPLFNIDSIFFTVSLLTAFDILIVSICFFLSMILEQFTKISKYITFVASLSYIFFLIHHQVIIRTIYNIFYVNKSIWVFPTFINPLLYQSLIIFILTFIISILFFYIEKILLSTSILDYFNKKKNTS